MLQRLAGAIDELLFNYRSEHRAIDVEEWHEDAPLYMRPWQPGEPALDAAYLPVHRFTLFPVRYEFLPLRFYIGDDGKMRDIPVELPEDLDIIAA